MKIVILDDWNHYFETQPSFARLRERGEVAVHYDRATGPALLDRLSGAGVILANRERTRFPAELLEALPDLELISQSGGAGRHIDLEAATRLGIAVAAAPGASNGPAAVAELGLGLLLSLARDIPRNDRRVREGDWHYPLSDVLHGKTLGIIGLGKIGRHMATVCQAMGIQVIAWGPTLTPERAAESGVEYVAFDDLFPRVDALFISPILSDLTRGIVGPTQLAAMKPTSYLVNISRGPIVQEAALVEALQQRRIRGAGMDVYDDEPLAPDHPYTKLDNVVLTPHIGWVTEAHFTRFVAGMVDNVLNYLDGTPTRIENPDALRVARGTRTV
jgi:D-3-phosphoglycerate dehydrogenase / 2-oxoglutarate reductase